MTTEITERELADARQTWGNALIAISKAFEEEGIDAARVVANGALDAAYGFAANGKVLFKPTVTTEPDTFRNTYEGALSYFVGECAGEDRVGDDKGFAFAYTVLSESYVDDKTLW